jgi:prepilin-type N-terminal cleavage/methylation domain-containing protein
MNKKQNNKYGFTIVELLVVISIIALLVGILVPAVNKARDTAKMTQSKSNLHQVTIAMANYSADWNGDHFTSAPPDLSAGARRGLPVETARQQMVGGSTPIGIRLGERSQADDTWVYFLNNIEGVVPYAFYSGNTAAAVSLGRAPMAGFGTWRYPNALQVAEYMNGLPLHKAYFSPKDNIALRALEGCDSLNGSMCVSSVGAGIWGGDPAWNSNMILAPSSYCISPAMMYNAQVYAWNPDSDEEITFTDPMDINTGFRPSTIDQAQFPNLKSWLMEHYWLQNPVTDCGLNWDGSWFANLGSCWDGCEPFHFNNSYKSAPITAFSDGHVGTFEVAQADRDDALVGQSNEMGLWHRFTGDGVNGYFNGRGSDWINWSGHTHTTGGIKGRDILGK